MKLKTLTKVESALFRNQTLNLLWGLDELVYAAQIEGKTEITFNPPMIVHKDVTKVFSSNPYNFGVEQTNEPNDMVRLTKITGL